MDAREALGAALPDEVPGLYRYARTLTRDRAQAEDLVQETLTRALEKADTFRGESSPATWLHRILHNLAADRARRSREVPVDEVAEAVETLWGDDAYTVDAETVALRAQTREDLEDALVHLPVPYRSAVLLHDVEGLTALEIAAVQSVSLPAAKQRLRRGRMMLVSELARGPERRAALKGVPMRCRDARSQVSDFLDGDLDDAQAALVVRHLEGCPTCPPLYAALVATTEALGDRRARSGDRDPDSVVPPELARRVAALLGRAAG
ncbi:MAG: sigma-70 family RNA polymerase sigma factor [Actinobacteria bacterium]|nr:sigma-70 family RNA polymerase sigma factor [Actinomycetota bacterium]